MSQLHVVLPLLSIFWDCTKMIRTRRTLFRVKSPVDLGYLGPLDPWTLGPLDPWPWNPGTFGTLPSFQYLLQTPTSIYPSPPLHSSYLPPPNSSTSSSQLLLPPPSPTSSFHLLLPPSQTSSHLLIPPPNSSF